MNSSVAEVSCKGCEVLAKIAGIGPELVWGKRSVIDADSAADIYVIGRAVKRGGDL